MGSFKSPCRNAQNRITIFGLEKKTFAILEFYVYSTFDFDHITVLGLSFCIRLSNFIQIRPSSVELWCYIDFHDGERWGAVLLPVSD